MLPWSPAVPYSKKVVVSRPKAFVLCGVATVLPALASSHSPETPAREKNRDSQLSIIVRTVVFLSVWPL